MYSNQVFRLNSYIKEANQIQNILSKFNAQFILTNIRLYKKNCTEVWIPNWIYWGKLVCHVNFPVGGQFISPECKSHIHRFVNGCARLVHTDITSKEKDLYPLLLFHLIYCEIGQLSPTSARHKPRSHKVSLLAASCKHCGNPLSVQKTLQVLGLIAWIQKCAPILFASYVT